MTNSDERSRKRAARLRRLTVAEITKVTADYHAAFPSWHALGKDTIYRANGPIAQVIQFERLSAMSYRPMIFIITFFRRLGYIHADFLIEVSRPNGLRNWTVELRSHEIEKPELVAAIKRQLRPSAQQPLELEAAYAACKGLGVEGEATRPEVLSLAAFAAYLDHTKEAYMYLDRFRSTREGVAITNEESADEVEFARQLHSWIDGGRARIELDQNARAERTALGFTDNLV